MESFDGVAITVRRKRPKRILSRYLRRRAILPTIYECSRESLQGIESKNNYEQDMPVQTRYNGLSHMRGYGSVSSLRTTEAEDNLVNLRRIRFRATHSSMDVLPTERRYVYLSQSISFINDFYPRAENDDVAELSESAEEEGQDGFWYRFISIFRSCFNAAA